MAELLTGRMGASPEQGVEWVATLCRELRIPSLRAYGVSTNDAPALVEQAAKASSMKANPIALTPEELHEVLEQAI